ncbi:hypothetical protein B9Z19DRAFT_679609 [Tuber borchii]|uniref:Secreted protein n=1 Tax=Tuber borchii TaxID=42251 RepID=A0A2T6ZZH0_TUBBO|nr:hypothetical protein B9Z19DRAFT_679609 [Tuber borchii]
MCSSIGDGWVTFILFYVHSCTLHSCCYGDSEGEEVGIIYFVNSHISSSNHSNGIPRTNLHPSRSYMLPSFKL